MKRNVLTDSVIDQPISRDDDEAANDNFNETDLQAFEASSDYYERRSRNRIKLHQGDWWIAVGLYLILLGVAFVVL